MGSAKSFIVGLFLIIATIVVSNSLYIVNEFERAVLLTWGQVSDPDISTGIHAKIPLMQNVRKFDGRIITVDAPAERFLTVEKKSMQVDSFAKWRIIDVSKYYTATSGDQIRAERLLAQRINEGLRNQFAQRSLQEVVSGERDELMAALKADLNNIAAKELGVEVVDVRVKAIDLPAEVSGPVYQRMSAERKREADEHRAVGREQATIIEAEAKREKEEIEASAYRDAELIRGAGDAEATKTYADAFNKNPEFYAFVRSLNAYRSSFKGKDDVILVDPDGDFFRYLKKARGD